MKRVLPDEPHWITLPEALDAWETGDGSGIRIAVLDSGVDTSHPAFEGFQLRDDIAISMVDGVPVVTGGEGSDSYGHGTGVAHVLHTVAPKAEIGSFRVLGSGEKGGGEGDVVREGVMLAMEKGYHILNCSFGITGSFFGSDRKLRFVEQNKVWLDEAYLRGIHVVSACNNYDSRCIEWPGHFANSITVDKVNCGTDEFFYRPGGLVEFAAKGYGVTVPWAGNAWKTVDGSSFAAPRVAGWLARLLSVYPFLTPPQVKGLLRHIALERPYLHQQSRRRRG